MTDAEDRAHGSVPHGTCEGHENYGCCCGDCLTAWRGQEARVDRVAEALWAHVEQDQSGLYVERSHPGGELLDGVVDMRKLAQAAIEAVERGKGATDD